MLAIEECRAEAQKIAAGGLAMIVYHAPIERDEWDDDAHAYNYQPEAAVLPHWATVVDRFPPAPPRPWTKYRESDGRYGIRGPDGRRLPGLVIGGGRRWAAEVGGKTIGYYQSAAAACAALFKATPSAAT